LAPQHTRLIRLQGWSRILFVAVCVIGAAGGVAAAMFWEIDLALSLAVVRDLPGRNYAWTDSDGDRLVGIRTSNTEVSADAWALGESAPDPKPVHTWSEAAPGPRSALAADAEVGMAAWVANGKLSARRLDSDRALAPVDVPRQAVAAMGILESGIAAILYADGSTVSVNPGAGVSSQGRIPMAAGDNAQITANWLAVRSQKDAHATVHRAGKDGSWTEHWRGMVPAGNRWILSSGGDILVPAKNGVWLGERFLPAPGLVRWAGVSRFGAVLVTGDFEGVHLVQDWKEPVRLAAAAPGSALSVRGRRAILASSRGTTVFSVRGGALMSLRGQVLIYTAAVLFGAVFLYVLALYGRLFLKVLLRLFGRVPIGFNREYAHRETPVPSELIQAFLSGRTILWAGSGLSAQAGYPTWNDMLLRLQHAAQTEGWFTPEILARLNRARASGDEEQLGQLIRALGSPRSRMVEFVCGLYSKPAQLSRSHYALYRMPFRSCLTTNYDDLLERLGPEWSSRVHTAQSEEAVFAAANGRFFLWKLNGSANLPQTVLLCSPELMAVAEASPHLRETLNLMFEANSFFFVGVSPTRLLRLIDGLIAFSRIIKRLHANPPTENG